MFTDGTLSLTNLINGNIDVGDLSYTAGQQAAQGAIDTVSPYVPWLGIAAFVLILGIAASGR